MNIRREKCNNCGWPLTEENIRLALEDASFYEQDELTFCCPSYTEEGGCKGTAKEDETLPAYWRTN